VSAAQQARAIVAGTNAATLATIAADGGPWASLVAFATLADGTPVLCVSTLAEHGRNLERDARASLAVAGPASGADPLTAPRVTLRGTVRRPGPGERDRARRAYLDAVPGAETYVDFADFTLWLVRVERVRWVGGYGRMESVDAAAYAAAAPAPRS
jgi:hypothetical protein